MMDRPRRWYRQMRAMKWFCPGSFVLCAMVCAAVYVVLYLLGWRESTSVLCGTLPEDRTAQTIQAFQATMYVIFYMGTAVVAPILVIAAIGWYSTSLLLVVMAYAYLLSGLVLNWRRLRPAGTTARAAPQADENAA